MDPNLAHRDPSRTLTSRQPSIDDSVVRPPIGSPGGERIVASAAPPGMRSHHSSTSGKSRETRERHKTMIVRQAASLLKQPPPPPPKEEEVKPVEPPPLKVDERHGKMMNVIMMWSKLTFRSKIVLMSQSFNRWKYAKMGDTQGSSEDPSKKEKMHDQKNSYLLLFKENEKLRESLAEFRRTSQQNERTMRDTAVGAVIRSFVRSKTTSKQRYYFDIWLNNARMMALVAATNQRSIQLEIGLQRIESERNYVTKMEELNTKLKLTLAMAICFFNWKGRAAHLTLTEERDLYEKQRKLIFNELIRIRKIVSMANKYEVAMMQGALLKGEELSNDLDNIRDQLIKAVKVGKATLPSNSAKDGGAGNVAVGGDDGGSSVNSLLSSFNSVAITSSSASNNNNASQHHHQQPHALASPTAASAASSAKKRVGSTPN